MGIAFVVAACAPKEERALTAANEGPVGKTTASVFGAEIEIDAMAPPNVSMDKTADGIPRAIVAVKIARMANVSCAITKSRVDPGAVVSTVVGRLDDGDTPDVNVTVVDDVPILVLERSYLAAVAAREDGTVFCAMDGAAHRARFERLVSQLVHGTLAKRDGALFRDVRVLKTLGKVSGYQVREVQKSGDARLAREWATVVVPKGVGAKHFRVVDGLRSSVLDADDRIVRSSEVLAANGRVVAKQTILRTRPGEYTFEVAIEDTPPTKGAFRSDLLSTELAMASRVRALRHGELRFDEWDATSKTVKTVLASRAAGRLVLSRGDTPQCEPDHFGLCSDEGAVRVSADGMP